MKILVTGCAGFIGHKVSDLLLRGGHAVIGVDNLNSSYDVRLKEWRLSRLLEEPDFACHRVDVIDGQAVPRLFQENSFDAVINLAARAGVRQSLEDPWSYYETNVAGTLGLLELCRSYQVKKFVLASTSGVYGAGDRPFREEGPTERPLSPYAASKKAAELLCFPYHELYGLDVSVLRYFTVYGPAGRPDMSIFRFIRWIAEGETLAVYGDGSQERDFTYVDDIARGTVAALKPLGFEIVNLGNDQPESLQTVISFIENLLGKQARIEYQPPNPADVSATRAAISKARQLLGWEPKVSLEWGLQKSVEWYLENRQWVSKIRLQ